MSAVASRACALARVRACALVRVVALYARIRRALLAIALALALAIALVIARAIALAIAMAIAMAIATALALARVCLARLRSCALSAFCALCVYACLCALFMRSLIIGVVRSLAHVCFLCVGGGVVPRCCTRGRKVQVYGRLSAGVQAKSYALLAQWLERWSYEP